VHERYDGAKRNPWNEVECGSHYSRSMASYGLFTAICGFECDGPLGYLAFAPRLAPENFKCAFTSAEGWGSFAQTVEHGVQKATITLKWGRLRLKEIVLAPVGAKIPATAKIAMDGRKIPCSFSNRDGRLVLTLSTESTLVQDQILVIEMQ
jgi:hypothetical protein